MSDTQIAEEDAPKCSVCSDTTVTLPTHRVIATANDGEVEYKHFCSASCESAYHT